MSAASSRSHPVGRVTQSLRKEQWPAGNAAVNATRIRRTLNSYTIYLFITLPLFLYRIVSRIANVRRYRFHPLNRLHKQRFACTLMSRSNLWVAE